MIQLMLSGSVYVCMHVCMYILYNGEEFVDDTVDAFRYVYVCVYICVCVCVCVMQWKGVCG
jgi:hypothetical protein